ncbi:MAG: HAD-IC family P-type ATPase [Chloroflexi bacterium]|nr:HAD-IC family P-type ATPase [Chloroflexota bacterium]
MTSRTQAPDGASPAAGGPPSAAPAAGSAAGPSADWHQLSPDDVAQRLGVDPAKGLTEAQAADAAGKYGPNALPAEKPEPEWRRFLDEYTSYLQIILVVAGVVSVLIGQVETAALLFLLTFINAIVGMREEGKAQSAMNALRSMMKEEARVLRDGAEAKVDAAALVPGDVVLLAAGDQVPADGRIIAAATLQIDESALTGESVPASKDPATLPAGKELGPGDQSNMAFMNTPVTHGSGTMIVTTTGGGTQVGRIAHMLSATKTEETPLTRQLNRMTLWIAAVAGVTMVIMFVLGYQRGQAMDTIFVTAVALAIAAVPEALPTVVQVILSMGAVDLAKRNAIVKNLTSVETLGATSSINSDKTGTLTMNQMTAVEVADASDRYTVTGTGYETAGQVQHAAGTALSIDDAILPYVIANDAKLQDGTVVGDPTEGALLVLAVKAGLSIDGSRSHLPRLATLPFDPTYKLMATFNSMKDATGKDVVRVFVKGAAPAVMDRAAATLSGASPIPFDADQRTAADANVARMEGEGLRVMAAAWRDLDPTDFDPNGDLLGYVKDLSLASLVGMIDPPRPTSKDAVQAAIGAHIRVRMVTGDDVVTGAAIAKQLGIPGEAILGEDFAKLSEDERIRRVDGIGVVGRVAPQHKVLLAQTLQKAGHVVAMTGDGVNDAPAIKAADIGIAMGTGTEVAKNAGRMILTDDNFATIIHAVEQGRKLYDNLTKYVRFILITLVAFVLTFLAATILNIAAGQPFTPAQILWINFVIDTPLGVALGFDAESPGIMKRYPRARNASILTRGVIVTAAGVGVFMAVWLVALIAAGIERTDMGGSSGMAAGVTMALTAFAYFRIVCVYESRSEKESVLTVSTFDNMKLNLTVLVEMLLAYLATQLDVLQHVLGTTPLSTTQWIVSLATAVTLLVAWEVAKAVARLVAKPKAPAAEEASAAA